MLPGSCPNEAVLRLRDAKKGVTCQNHIYISKLLCFCLSTTKLKAFSGKLLILQINCPSKGINFVDKSKSVLLSGRIVELQIADEIQCYFFTFWIVS